MGNSAGVANSPVVQPTKPHQAFVGVIELIDKEIRRLDNASRSEQGIQEYIQASQRDTMTPGGSSKVEDDSNITSSVTNTVEKVCSALDKIKQRLERLHLSMDNFGEHVLHQCEEMESGMKDEVMKTVSDRLTDTANAVCIARERLEPIREHAIESSKDKHVIPNKLKNEVDSPERPTTSFTEADRDRYEKEMKQMKDIIDNLEDELESLKHECNETEISLDTANERMQKIEEKILEERLTHEVEVNALRAIVEKQDGMIKSLNGNNVNEEWLENQKNMMFSLDENDEKMSNDTCFDLIYVDQKSIADDQERKVLRASKYEIFTKSKENINYDSSSLASTRLAFEERNASKNEVVRNVDSSTETNGDLETPSRVVLSFPKQVEDQYKVTTNAAETHIDTGIVSEKPEIAMPENNISENSSQNKQMNDRDENDYSEGTDMTTEEDVEDNINNTDTVISDTRFEKGYEKSNSEDQQHHNLDSRNGMDHQISHGKHFPEEVTPGETFIIKPDDANVVQQKETQRNTFKVENATPVNASSAPNGSDGKGLFDASVLNHKTENIVETTPPVKASATNGSGDAPVLINKTENSVETVMPVKVSATDVPNTNDSFDAPVLIHKTENIVESAMSVKDSATNVPETNEPFDTPVLIHKTENMVETARPVKVSATNGPHTNDSFDAPVLIHKTDKSVDTATPVTVCASNKNDSLDAPLLTHKTETIIETVMPVKVSAKIESDRNDSSDTPHAILQSENIEKNVEQEPESLGDIGMKEEVLMYEEGIVKEIIYKRNDGEVDGCLSYYKGLGAIIRTSVEDFGVDTVQCDVTDAVQNEMLPDLVEGERAISFYIHIHKKYGTSMLMKDGDYVTIYVPHRIIPEHEEATLVCSINGDDWEQCDLEDDVPVSVSQGVHVLGTALRDVSDVKLVAIAREKTIQLIAGEDDVTHQSLVDPSVSVKINTECFPARCGVSLIVRHSQQRALASAVDIHRECLGIVSCTAFVSLVCERVTTEDMYVMMSLPPGIDYECKFTIFVQSDSGWKLADCDWNKATQVLTIHLAAGTRKYRVIGLELPYEMSVEERLVAVHTLQIHSTEHYTVRVMFRQKDSDPSQAVVICMRADLVEQGIAQLKETGYTIGGAPSEQFCLIDGDVLSLECSGDITAKPYKAKRMEVPFHSQKEIASRQITLHPVSSDTRSGAKLYQATLTVMKKGQQNYVVLVETIHMPTEKS